jgi:hypothetical protein
MLIRISQLEQVQLRICSRQGASVLDVSSRTLR